MGQKGTQHHIERGKSTFTLGAAPVGQHNASGVRPAIGCWYTSLLPVLSCSPWEGNFARCVLTRRHQACLCRTAWGRRHCGRHPPPSSCDSGWDEKHKHTRSDNVAPALAVSTVVVVVRQLVRGNAIAHVVFVPRYHIKPRRGRPGRCVLTSDTKLAVQSSSTDHGVSTMVSGTRMTNFCVASQPTLQSASRKPFSKNRKSSA